MHSDGTSKLITPNLQVPTTKLVKCTTSYLTIDRTLQEISNPPRSQVPKEGVYQKLSNRYTYRKSASANLSPFRNRERIQHLDRTHEEARGPRY
jgi:hypothetical protein